jgi:hypothetical protein
VNVVPDASLGAVEGNLLILDGFSDPGRHVNRQPVQRSARGRESQVGAEPLNLSGLNSPSTESIDGRRQHNADLRLADLSAFDGILDEQVDVSMPCRVGEGVDLLGLLVVVDDVGRGSLAKYSSCTEREGGQLPFYSSGEGGRGRTARRMDVDGGRG